MFSSNTSSADGGYQISRSLRFNQPDSTSLNRTPSSASNRKTWTWSGWVKRSALITNNTPQNLFGARNGSGTPYTLLRFNDGTTATNYSLVFQDDNGATLITTAQYRDVSAWYHIVLAVDTTQATASNRVRLYVNGVEVTAFSTATYPTQNLDTAVNSTIDHRIGAQPVYGDNLSGYMTEVYLIDGQQLTPSSFGETNAQTGVWQPKAYAGSYGTNGFYLNFSDNSNTTAATLGKDYSGNGNNWTPNNFSVAAGAGNDSLVDTPTPYGSDTGAGGEVRGNYCTLNPLDTGTVTLANGNLDVTFGTSARGTRATFGVSTGKYYFEMTVGAFGSNGPAVGVAYANANITTNYAGSDANAWVYNGGDGKIYNNGVATGSNATYTTNDVIGVAINMDSGTVTFYKNNSAQPSTVTGLSGTVFPVVTAGVTAGVQYLNFGQRAFAYTAPSGFKALCTQNLPTPTIGATTATQAGKYFNPVLWTGTGSTQNITGVGFESDFIWMKNRSVNGRNHYLFDRLRGITNARLFSNLTDAENTSTTYINSTNSDGYQLAAGDAGSNGSGETYVGWNWKANGSGVTNTAGFITSTVSANTTSGFSIVTYTGNGTGTAANGTVGHGLGVVPSMIIIKRRNSSGFWWVATRDGGTSTSPTYSWFTRGSSGLNQSGAAFGTGQTFASSGYITSTTFNVYWLNAAVSAGDSYDINFNTGTYVAYCFASIAGYSAFGSYTGNSSSDGPFIYCGFRPRYVLIKLSSGGLGDWMIYDAVRNTSNVMSSVLYADLANAEGTVTGIDFTSNGFKLRGTSTDFNGGYTYIYAAFAESPFKYALAR